MSRFNRVAARRLLSTLAGVAALGAFWVAAGAPLYGQL